MNEHIKKTAEFILDNYFLPIKPFQDYVNNRYKGKMVPVPDNNDSYYCYKGLKFSINKEIGTIQQVINDYVMDDIRHDDIVLDVGANIGAFSLFAAQKCDKVLSIEPIFFKELNDNIRLNGFDNISVSDDALGIGEMSIKVDPTHSGTSRLMKCKSLTEIINLFGYNSIDFLKLDCEGGEWCIKPEELEGIRRIEAEIHDFYGTHPFIDFLHVLDTARFEYEYSVIDKQVMLVHAKNKE